MEVYPKGMEGSLSWGSIHGRISLVGIYPKGMEGSLSWGSIRRLWKDLSSGDGDVVGMSPKAGRRICLMGISEEDGRISLMEIYPKGGRGICRENTSEEDGRISLVGIYPKAGTRISAVRTFRRRW